MAGINVHFRDSGNALQSQVFGTEQTAFLLYRLGPNATVNTEPSGILRAESRAMVAHFRPDDVRELISVASPTWPRGDLGARRTNDPVVYPTGAPLLQPYTVEVFVTPRRDIGKGRYGVSLQWVYDEGGTIFRVGQGFQVRAVSSIDATSDGHEIGRQDLPLEVGDVIAFHPEGYSFPHGLASSGTAFDRARTRYSYALNGWTVGVLLAA